jgi:hypothetical protein
LVKQDSANKTKRNRFKIPLDFEKTAVPNFILAQLSANTRDYAEVFENIVRRAHHVPSLPAEKT